MITETEVDNRAGGEPTISQWIDEHRPVEQSPDQKLRWAVLQDAIETYLHYRGGAADSKPWRYFHQAEDWLFNDPPGCGFGFSFREICDLFRLDADYLRQGLPAARARGARIAHRGRVGGRGQKPKRAIISSN